MLRWKWLDPLRPCHGMNGGLCLCFLIDLPEPTGGDAPAAAAAPAPVAPGAELMSGKSSDVEVPT